MYGDIIMWGDQDCGYPYPEAEKKSWIGEGAIQTITKVGYLLKGVMTDEALAENISGRIYSQRGHILFCGFYIVVTGLHFTLEGEDERDGILPVCSTPGK